MIEFVIGGTAQGKLKYVMDKNNLQKKMFVTVKNVITTI